MRKILAKALVFSMFFLTGMKASAQDIQTAWFNQASPFTFTSDNSKVCEVLSVLGVVKVGSFTLTETGVPYLFPGTTTFYSSNAGQIIYRIRDNVSTVTTTPTSSVVIPTDATGPVNVILESSTDLVTWTEANPGTYGASTTKRFFRVRAVNQ